MIAALRRSRRVRRKLDAEQKAQVEQSRAAVMPDQGACHRPFLVMTNMRRVVSCPMDRTTLICSGGPPATALNLTVPPKLLATADEVIK